MRCFALHRTTGVVAHVAAGVNPAVAVSGYGPSDLDSAYSVPTTLGSGKTVAIVDAYDDPNAASDLSTYRSNFGLPACTTANGCFKKVNQNGATSPLPAANTGWAGEEMLDIDMVSAICPNCHILLVEANSPTTANLGTAVNTAVALGAMAVSNSYGGSESSSETSYDTSYYNHPGVAIVASSGDSGYTRRVPGRLAVRDGRRRHRPVTGEQRARLDGVRLVDVLERGRGERLLGLRGEAVVPERHRLLAAHDRRRLRGRRPGHRRRRLRLVRLGRLDGLRRHERRVADHRRDVRAGQRAGAERVPELVPVRQSRARSTT